MNWTLAQRTRQMNPSVIRDLLKLTEQGHIISFAGGLPSPKTFAVDEFAAACARVLREDGAGALQYAASEGYAPLRELVAAMLAEQSAAAGVPWAVDPAQIIITTGSQQGLDLVAKVLLDEGSRALVESPTYLGAVQAFAPMQPEIAAVDCDDEGVLPQALRAQAQGPLGRARFLYVLPNFQNPTGRTMGEQRRVALCKAAQELGLPLVEDNPYGDLWFDTAPPAPLAARLPEQCIYLGSFSKVLAPSLRLGFLVAPKAVYAKLLQAKQAADLHSPGLNQRLVHTLLRDGFLQRHVPGVRALYHAQRDAMLAALERHFGPGTTTNANDANDAPAHDHTLRWNQPQGGMFLWARLPRGMDATALLPHAVRHGVAFVPGAPFYANAPDARTMRLSFVTASTDEIERGVAALAQAIRQFPQAPQEAP